MLRTVFLTSFIAITLLFVAPGCSGSRDAYHPRLRNASRQHGCLSTASPCATPAAAPWSTMTEAMALTTLGVEAKPLN